MPGSSFETQLGRIADDMTNLTLDAHVLYFQPDGEIEFTGW